VDNDCDGLIDLDDVDDCETGDDDTTADDDDDDDTSIVDDDTEETPYIPTDDGELTGGCNCRVAGARTAPAALLALAALAVLVRRRNG